MDKVSIANFSKFISHIGEELELGITNYSIVYVCVCLCVPYQNLNQQFSISKNKIKIKNDSPKYFHFSYYFNIFFAV